MCKLFLFVHTNGVSLCLLLDFNKNRLHRFNLKIGGLALAYTINMIEIVIDDSSMAIYNCNTVASGLCYKHDYDHN
jgi:hypothetical protein